jgi:hypothetical protein
VTDTIHKKSYLGTDAIGSADDLNSVMPSDFLFDADTTEELGFEEY